MTRRVWLLLAFAVAMLALDIFAWLWLLAWLKR